MYEIPVQQVIYIVVNPCRKVVSCLCARAW